MATDKAFNKDVMKAIRLLKRTRRDHTRGSSKWKELSDKIKEMEKKLHPEDAIEYDPRKKDMIKKILAHYKTHNMYISPEIDLNNYTFAQLEFHYMKMIGEVQNLAEYNTLRGITVTKHVFETTSVRRRS